MGGERPEIPGWQEDVLKKLKALADAGNPLAQANYGEYVNDYSYVKKVAEQGLKRASRMMSVHYFNEKPVTHERAKAALYYGIQCDIENSQAISYERLSRIYTFRTADRSLVIPTQKEYQKQLNKALEWHKKHPYRYRYVHPMHILK